MDNTEQKALLKKPLEQFMSGKSLFGKDGAFAPMLKQFIETALELEMEEHLSKTAKKRGEKRNGKGSKTTITA
jgi:putative transposase